MSGEKTEKATPKRRRDARKKGQVAKSIEINSAIILLFIFLGLQIFGNTIYSAVKELFYTFLSNDHISLMEPDVDSLNIFILCFKYFILISGPAMLIGMLIALIINYVQVGFMFLPNMLAMKFDRINPLSGFKRLFSLKSAVNMLKSIIKMLIVGMVVYKEFMNNYDKIHKMALMEISQSSLLMIEIIKAITWKAGLILLIFGIFDYAYQKWEFEKSIRMSKEEIKQEYKLMEGDPKIKSRIREIQRQMAMRRMMQNIKNADVVITNPTHYAVAIKYDQNKGRAPIVVAKGQNLIALKIKEEAKKNRIEIVENKPLAQALYKSTDIDCEIPEELYKAVAEILATVYKSRGYI